MIKWITKLSCVVFLWAGMQVQAQEIAGIATYKTKTTVDLNAVSGQKLTEQMKQLIMEQMKPMLEKTYTLTFTKDESLYEEEESLSPEGSFMTMMGGMFSQGDTYMNTAKDLFAQENELMGKKFLIKDTLGSFKWKLEKESKMIGKYAAFKATAVKADEGMWKKATKRAKEWREKNGEKIDSAAIKKQDEILEGMQNVTVWYTPQIPVKHGPDSYHGLPGLILEVNVGATTILCSKVVLNPKEEINLEMPDSGEEVTRKEFAKITEEKSQEMMDRYGGGKSRRGGF
ncbi:GLPGLI family protein [Mesonia ostreae]|uniref:GLPGLI family protein n=1 Tax=Mesonia ostreae TaxID=861110 RepID=A0ABU2KFB6_9FLAO|nr:GLPGLI family protein [Mesonia ostreae]MDT0293399.1 GLPGLI family protein [Mesonia ostreae]